MKSLFTFIAEHSINWSLIWSDCSIYICIWLFICLVLTIVIASNYGHSVRNEAEEKADSVVQSLSHELDMLELQNCYLRQSFTDHKKEIERLSKFERKRDEKGHFITKSGKGHGKKKEVKQTDIDWTKATEEELIAEAKRRYPIGTLFYSALGDKNPSKCVCNGGYIFQQNYRGCKNIIWAHNNRYILCGFLYHNGIWAKIIKS